jgi:CBS domain-containing protein
MLVEDVMQGAVITIAPKTVLPEAMRLVPQCGIRHLPVVENDALVGIVSDRDIKLTMASPATSLATHELRYLLDTLTVEEIMTRAVITVGAPSRSKRRRLMVKEKVSAHHDAQRPIGTQGRRDPHQVHRCTPSHCRARGPRVRRR